MVVTVDEIQDSGLQLDKEVPASLLQTALAEDGGAAGFRSQKGFELKAKLRKVSDGVLIQGSFVIEVTAPCKRCLAEVPLTVPVNFTLNLVPRAVVAVSMRTPATRNVRVFAFGADHSTSMPVPLVSLRHLAGLVIRKYLMV